jgi:translation initiation factor 3 subunit A
MMVEPAFEIGSFVGRDKPLQIFVHFIERGGERERGREEERGR